MILEVWNGWEDVTKSELIAALAARNRHLLFDDTVLGVNSLLSALSDALASGERVEIRGFGAFSLRYRRARAARNPKTGETVVLPARYGLHFKAGQRLRERGQAPE
jgi:integration host factor subunit beta